jgi:hypothetical protein
VYLHDLLEEKSKKPLYVYWPLTKSSIFWPLRQDMVSPKVLESIRSKKQSKQASNVEMKGGEEIADPWSVWNPNNRLGITHSFPEPAEAEEFTYTTPSMPRGYSELEFELWDRSVLSVNHWSFSIEEFVEPDASGSSLPNSLPLVSTPSTSAFLAPLLTPQHWLLIGKHIKVKVNSSFIVVKPTARPTGIFAT